MLGPGLGMCKLLLIRHRREPALALFRTLVPCLDEDTRKMFCSCFVSDDLGRSWRRSAAQIALPRYKADDRDRAVRRLCFNQLRKFLSFLVNESQVGCVTGKPKDQFIEKKHDCIVAER